MAKRISVVSFLVMLLFFQTDAQLFSGRASDTPDIKTDTAQNKKQLKTNDSIVIYYVSAWNNVHQRVDTTIINQYRNPFISIWDRDLGNTGTAYTSLLYKPNMNPAMKLGMQNNLGYIPIHDSLKFYNTTRPYTDIYYWMGRKQEQCIQLFHTQNITSDWNLSASYRKLVSPGNFKYLRSNQDIAYLNSWYRSKKQRYESKASLIYAKVQQDESGGILSESQLSDASFVDRRLLPVLYEASSFSVNRSSVVNSIRKVSFNLNHHYFFGKTVKDSLGNTTFLPSFGLKHLCYSDFIYQFYEDQEPDSAEYGYIYNLDQSNKASLYHKHFLTQIGNSFSINQNIRLKGKVTRFEAGYGLEYERINTRKGVSTFLNNFIFGQLQKEQQEGDRWNYNALVKFYFTGNAKGNFMVRANVGRKISEHLGYFNLEFNQSLQSPDYKQTYYYYDLTSEKNGLKKIAINHLAARYINTSKHFNVVLQQYSILNMIYIDTNQIIRQYGSLIPVTQGLISKTFAWRNWKMDNDVFFQQAPNNSPIHIPNFATSNRLYLNRNILKEKLAIATGIEMRYNSPFKTDLYIPVFQSFTPQYTRTISNIPGFSYFFNFKIKRFRAALSFDEIQQLYAVNNLNYPLYPTPNFMIRFKLNWVFIN
ncbi:MAG: hypothetical protein JNM95_02835 [Chitinophagaceae bacterium]|nr:hypothetical protein [Chitinophagaceae bacterium]